MAISNRFLLAAAVASLLVATPAVFASERGTAPSTAASASGVRSARGGRNARFARELERLTHAHQSAAGQNGSLLVASTIHAPPQAAAHGSVVLHNDSHPVSSSGSSRIIIPGSEHANPNAKLILPDEIDAAKVSALSGNYFAQGLLMHQLRTSDRALADRVEAEHLAATADRPPSGPTLRQQREAQNLRLVTTSAATREIAQATQIATRSERTPAKGHPVLKALAAGVALYLGIDIGTHIIGAIADR